MAKTPFYQATKDRWIVKDLFAKNYVSTGDDLFSITEVSTNGRDGFFNSKEEIRAESEDYLNSVDTQSLYREKPELDENAKKELTDEFINGIFSEDEKRM